MSAWFDLIIYNFNDSDNDNVDSNFKIKTFSYFDINYEMVKSVEIQQNPMLQQGNVMKDDNKVIRRYIQNKI